MTNPTRRPQGMSPFPGELLVLIVLAASALAAERKPNFLFILADDLGWSDLGC